MAKPCLNGVEKPLNKPYDLIIFDCDGTLVDSEYMNMLALVEVLHDFGLTQYKMDYALDAFGGFRFSAITELITKETGHVFPEDASLKYRQKVHDFAPIHMKSIEGVMDMVHTAQSFAKTCVVSNGERNNVTRSLDFVGLKPLFSDNDVISGLMAPNPKPAPDLFLMAAEKAGVCPSKTLVLEDSTTGVIGALAAGMEVWGFCGTHHEAEKQATRLLDIGATKVFHKMSGISEALVSKKIVS